MKNHNKLVHSTGRASEGEHLCDKAPRTHMHKKYGRKEEKNRVKLKDVHVMGREVQALMTLASFWMRLRRMSPSLITAL